MLSTEKAFDILPYISDIYGKLDIKEFIKEYQEDKEDLEDVPSRQMLAGLDIFAFVMKKSAEVKEEFFNIVAIVEDKEVKEVKEQSFAKTIKTIKDLFTDEEMNDFFKEAMQ